VTTELHVHDWTPWGLSPLSDAARVMRRQRSCRGCELYQDEPTPDVPVGLVPDSAIEAAAKALYAELEPYVSHSRMTYSGSIGTRTTGIAAAVLAAAVPHIERAARAVAFTEAADEIHREARWQKESQMRGMFANGEMSVDRLAMLEDILRSFADLAVARGGEATK
jgi:hypothetical protein